jgi:release factor glutamine methyltransferase
MPSLKEIQEKFKLLPSGDVLIILADIIGCDPAYILAHPEYRPNVIQCFKIRTALKKLPFGYPVAVILGHKEFFCLDFLVNRHTLIPRPDTEIMVEEVKNIIRENEPGGDKQMMIDVGTGSGCIPIAIIKSLNHQYITAIAIDISRDALRVARKNAKRHNVDIHFVHGDLISNLEPTLSGYDSFIITANLPYLTGEQYRAEPSIWREPIIALVSDSANGLDIYAKLFGQINNLLKNGRLYILCEIDPRQNIAASALAKKYFPNADIEIKKDLSGRDRLLMIKQASNLKR